jgi:hypothetical protein
MKILNAGPGFSQPMTEDETRLFLTSGRRNIHIATPDEKINTTSIQFGIIMIQQIKNSISKHQKIQRKKRI